MNRKALHLVLASCTEFTLTKYFFLITARQNVYSQDSIISFDHVLGQKKNYSFKCGSVNGWNAFFVDIWTQWICAIAFVGHVHIERNLFMSLDRTSASCDLCALEPIQDLSLKIQQSSIQGVPHLWGFSLPTYLVRASVGISCYLVESLEHSHLHEFFKSQNLRKAGTLCIIRWNNGLTEQSSCRLMV